MRLDKYVQNFLNISRSSAAKMIESGMVFVNGKKLKASYIWQEKDKLKILEQRKRIFKESKFRDLKILYEDKDCFVIDKPAGAIVHPSSKDAQTQTLVEFILPRIDKGVGEILRPGIVHRLDKDTSGALVVAKTQKGYEHLIKQFKNRKVKKIYLALVLGQLPYSQSFIDAPVGRSVFNRKKMAILDEKEGKQALSKFKVLETFKIDEKQFSLVEVEIMTGRTHQIRLHMSAIGNPVVLDITYGDKNLNKYFQNRFALDRQFLHAETLIFISPETGKTLKIHSKTSEDLARVLDRLSKEV